MPSMLKDGQKAKQTDWEKDRSNEANSHFSQFCERAETCSYFYISFPLFIVNLFETNTVLGHRISSTLTQVTNVPIFYFIWPIFIVTAVSRLITYNVAHSVPCSRMHYSSKLFVYVGIILLSSIINRNSDSIGESHVSLSHVVQIQFLMTCNKLGRNFSSLAHCFGKDNNLQSNVYWTVHHCNSWRMKDQLDVTCYFISRLICSTCFGH